MDTFLPAIKGWRNGFFYGGKIRLVHSLVMTLLFKSFNRKTVEDIFRLAYEHASNLGKFAFVYKSLCILLGKTFWSAPWNSLIAGSIGGFVVFSEKTPVNYQIVLYLFSRIVMGVLYLLYKTLNKRLNKSNIYSDEARNRREKVYFKVASGVAWGVIMFLFAYDRTLIQSSISSSMEFIYEQSNQPLQSWRELVPFKIPGQ